MLAALRLKNLRPTDFRTATDPDAPMKSRWAAFDRLAAQASEDMREAGLGPNRLADDPEWPYIGLAPGEHPDPAAMADWAEAHADRREFATALMTVATEGREEMIEEVLWGIESLVPSPPNPATGGPPMTAHDQVLLRQLVWQARDEMPREFERFFLQDSVPLEARREEFDRLCGLIIEGWRRGSFFARLQPAEPLRRFVIVALMSCVDGSEWGQDDLDRMFAELAPSPDSPGSAGA
jgi:hypothetical protein